MQGFWVSDFRFSRGSAFRAPWFQAYPEPQALNSVQPHPPSRWMASSHSLTLPRKSLARRTLAKGLRFGVLGFEDSRVWDCWIRVEGQQGLLFRVCVRKRL